MSKYSNLTEEEITRTTLQRPIIAKYIIHFSVANLRDKSIFITGGLGLQEAVNWLLIYDIKSNSWREGPLMNQARFNHSSCVVGTTLFVFCGQSQVGNISGYVASIESIEVGKGSIKSELARWSQIDPLN